MPYNLEKKYWDDRYAAGHNSGYGSYGEQLVKKINWLTGWKIDSISEIGCGDFNFGLALLRIYPNAFYAGQDISEVIINKNKQLYSSDKTTFTTDIDELPSADLLLCIDVLFHVLDDKDLEELLDKIESKWTNYLAITAYERDEELNNHVRVRKFDYKRFGEPLVRSIVEEDGKMFFYLFKKDSVTSGVDPKKVTCCLMTKDKTYPPEILAEIKKIPFGEVLILCDSDSPYNKYNLFEAAKNDLIYYQDDDAICPIKDILKSSNPTQINVAMKPGHFDAYKNSRMTMGLGWGSVFSKSRYLPSLKKYTDIYGKDSVFKRETERILTYLNYPQNRMVFPIKDLPSAYDPSRLYRQPEHNANIKIVEDRCSALVL